MKLVQSLDTTLIRDIHLSNGMLDKVNNYVLILRMTVLSHSRIIKFYGEENVELYVDDYVYEHIKDIFPKTLRKLSDIIPINRTHIWTQSKLLTMKHIDEPFIHIDCDVIFKEKINLNSALYNDIYVERKEDAYTFNWYQNGINYIDDALNACKELDFDLSSIEKYWNKNLCFAYNCGIVGFRNMTLKNKYIEFYEQLENLYTYYLTIKPYYEQIFVVLEQYALNCFAKYENCRVGTLLQFDNLNEQGEFAKRIGYVHLFGIGKFLDSNVIKVSKILHTEFPELYEKIRKIETEFKNENPTL